MAAERQEALREFVAVTGTEEDRARFFLESAGWDLQVAPRGGLRRAGQGLRGTGAWRVKPVVAEAHSHPAGLRPDTGLRGLWPLATRRQLALVVGERGPVPPPTCFAGPSALRVRGASETGHCSSSRGDGEPGGVATAPRSAGGRAGMASSERSGAGHMLVVHFHLRSPTAGGGRSPD